MIFQTPIIMSTHHVELGRGPLDGAVAAARGEHDDEHAEAGEEEGQAGGDVAVQLEVLVQLEGDPKAGKQKDGPGRLKGREKDVNDMDRNRKVFSSQTLI